MVDKNTEKTPYHTGLLDHPSKREILDFYSDVSDLESNFTSPVEFYNYTRNYFNCYAYAAGSLGNGFVQNNNDDFVNVMAVPGALSGAPMPIFTPEAFHQSVLADGFKVVDPALYQDRAGSLPERDGQILVAAFLNQDSKFHFAMQGKDQRWSHKNGNGEVSFKGYADQPLQAPHVSAAEYMGDDYHFAGYYWRPEQGINVIAGETPKTAFYKDGTMVKEGLFDPKTMQKDVWLGTRGDYVATSFEISEIFARKAQNGGYDFTLKGEFDKTASISLPKEKIFNDYEWTEDKGLTKTGHKVLEVDDPSGPDLSVILKDDGTAPIKEREPSVPVRPAVSPFTLN